MITFETVTLTTDLAQDLLSRNSTNRPVKQRVVGEYADDMKHGRWRFTAEAVKIDEHGNLLDGQHRCLALIQANLDLEEGAAPITVKTLVVRGLETEAQDVMDSGTRRSVADQLARRGSSSSALVAGASRCILAFKLNTDRPPRPDVIRFYDEHREILDGGSRFGQSYNNTSSLSPSGMLAAWFLISEVCDDEEVVGRFFHLLRTGAELPEKSPIMALRNRASTAKVRRESIPNTIAMGLVLRCWNAWRTGTTMQKVPVRTRGALVSVKSIEP